MPTARDNQRQRLYDAENRAFERMRHCHAVENGAPVLSVAECKAYYERVQGRKYLQRKYGLRLTERIYVRDGRGYRIATAYPGIREIQLPRWARTEGVMLHELGHLLTPQRYSWHGPEFAAIFLDLVQHMLGRDTADRLRASFHLHRVRVLTASGVPRVPRIPASAAEWAETNADAAQTARAGRAR